MKKFTRLLSILAFLCFFQVVGSLSGENQAFASPRSAKGSLGKACRPDGSCNKKLICKDEVCVQRVITGEGPSGEPAPQGGGGGDGTPLGGSEGTSPVTRDPNHIEGYYRSVWNCQCEGISAPMENEDESITFRPYPKDNGSWVMYYDVTNGGFIYQGGNCSMDRSGGISKWCEKCIVSGKTVTFKPCRIEGCTCDIVWTKTREFEKD